MILNKIKILKKLFIILFCKQINKYFLTLINIIKRTSYKSTDLLLINCKLICWFSIFESSYFLKLNLLKNINLLENFKCFFFINRFLNTGLLVVVDFFEHIRLQINEEK
jgi:hypothetical protein